MIKLIKMNLYRMTHAVSTWVLMACMIAMTLFAFSMNKLVLDDPFNMNLSQGMQDVPTYMTSIDSISSYVQVGMIIMLVGIFVVIFTNAEHKCGFDKNIVGITKSRAKQTIARWISSIIGATALTVVGQGFYIGLSAAFMNDFRWDSAKDFLCVCAVAYLGLVTFVTLFFFFTTLFNSSTGGIVATCFISTGLLALIESLLDKVADKIFSSPAHVPSDFFLDSAFMYLDLNSVAVKGCTFFLILCAAYIVLSLGGSVLLQQKRDIR